jgi:hypothetical protein
MHQHGTDLLRRPGPHACGVVVQPPMAVHTEGVQPLSADIGCRGLLVHAESAQAREFYLHLVPEFEASPTDTLHLLVLMKDVRRTLLG